MLPILIFDLDDTLYPESSFVQSGLAAVAEWLEEKYGWAPSVSMREMNKILAEKGRGAIFDVWLQKNGVSSRTSVQQCVRVYRHHTPKISLYPQADRVFRKLKRKPYIVTDGHKVAQYNKIKALRLEDRCAKVILTHRYGVHNEKPSTYCFQRILERERGNWKDMIYVGDNPAKDFVGLNPLGVRTVRVKTGAHAYVQAKPGFDAIHSVDHLGDLPKILPDLDWRQ